MENSIKSFDQLTTQELYDLLELRQQVFILEQQCFYLDIDGKDQTAQHFLHYGANRTLDAYLRLRVLEDNAFIQRVIVTKQRRGHGLASSLLREALAYITAHHPDKTVRLSSQLYCSGFYANLGFKPVSEPYDDEGIMHVDMQLTME